MRILSFDTATRATAVALRDDQGLELEGRDDPAPGERPRHNTRLMALVLELLERAGVGWEAIDRIGVGIGPGTFTGLRIGIATARALAATRRIPLVGVSTLQSLALGAFGGDARHEDVIAALDARRNEVFAAGWHRDASAEPFFAPETIAPEQLAELIARRGSGALVVGEGAVAFQAVLERANAVIPEPTSMLHRVSAVTHCRLAASLRPEAPDHIHPEYLRLPDAEIARRASGNR